MTATMFDAVPFSFANSVDLLVFADAIYERGDEERANEYRTLAQLVEKHDWLGAKLDEVKTLGQLLPRWDYNERCLCTLLQDKHGRFTDGRIITTATKQERRTLLRRKFDRERRPYPLDAVYPLRGNVIRLVGAEVREKTNHPWPMPQTTEHVVILDDGVNQYQVRAKYYGLLCRRHPRATWHASKYNAAIHPLSLVENGKIVALCMPLTGR